MFENGFSKPAFRNTVIPKSTAPILKLDALVFGPCSARLAAYWVSSSLSAPTHLAHRAGRPLSLYLEAHNQAAVAPGRRITRPPTRATYLNFDDFRNLVVARGAFKRLLFVPRAFRLNPGELIFAPHLGQSGRMMESVYEVAGL